MIQNPQRCILGCKKYSWLTEHEKSREECNVLLIVCAFRTKHFNNMVGIGKGNAKKYNTYSYFSIAYVGPF